MTEQIDRKKGVMHTAVMKVGRHKHKRAANNDEEDHFYNNFTQNQESLSKFEKKKIDQILEDGKRVKEKLLAQDKRVKEGLAEIAKLEGEIGEITDTRLVQKFIDQKYSSEKEKLRG